MKEKIETDLTELNKYADLREKIQNDKTNRTELKEYINTANKFACDVVSSIYKKELISKDNITRKIEEIEKNIDIIKRTYLYFDYHGLNALSISLKNANNAIKTLADKKEYKKEEEPEKSKKSIDSIDWDNAPRA